MQREWRNTTSHLAKIWEHLEATPLNKTPYGRAADQATPLNKAPYGRAADQAVNEWARDIFCALQIPSSSLWRRKGTDRGGTLPDADGWCWAGRTPSHGLLPPWPFLPRPLAKLQNSYLVPKPMAELNPLLMCCQNSPKDQSPSLLSGHLTKLWELLLLLLLKRV